LALEVIDLAKKMRELPSLTDDFNYFISQFTKIGADPAKDAAKELIVQVTTGGRVKNIKGQLQAVFDDGELALKAVKDVHADLPDYPDFSHLSYCDQVSASQDQIKRIEDTIGNLDKLITDAQFYKRTLLSLDQMTSVLGRAFEQLAPFDDGLEETTVGTFTAEMFYFTNSPLSDDEPNARYLLSNASDRWNNVEQVATEKANKLRKILDARKSFDEHFYSLAMQKCADDRARDAALASLGIPASTVVQPMVIPADEACQATLQQATLLLSNCMQPQSSMCANFTTAASCYSRAASLCGACGSCGNQFQSAASQARTSAQQVCAH
jgi:hypothetical protein